MAKVEKQKPEETPTPAEPQVDPAQINQMMDELAAMREQLTALQSQPQPESSPFDGVPKEMLTRIEDYFEKVDSILPALDAISMEIGQLKSNVPAPVNDGPVNLDALQAIFDDVTLRDVYLTVLSSAIQAAVKSGYVRLLVDEESSVGRRNTLARIFKLAEQCTEEAYRLSQTGKGLQATEDKKK